MAMGGWGSLDRQFQGVCVCVCMRACMHACVGVCLFVYVRASMLYIEGRSIANDLIVLNNGLIHRSLLAKWLT